jgi:ferric iron reductase protein FhuF
MQINEKIIDELKMLFGLPPHNVPSNTCWNDNYFYEAMRQKLGEDPKAVAMRLGLAAKATSYYTGE